MRKYRAYHHNRTHSNHSNRRGLWIGIIASVLLIVGVSILFYAKNIHKSTDSQSLKTSQITDNTKPSQPEVVNGRYLFNGTIVLARMVEKAAGNNLHLPFSQMHTFEPVKYDTMTLDWECPTTDDIIPYQTQVDNLLFNCHKKWLPEVSKLFGVVSLANNHSGDLGAEAYGETQRNLEDAGIQTYGHYDPSVEEDVCEIVALPVRLQMPDKTVQKATLPVAFCAWHYFFRNPKDGEMEIMRQYAEIMPVFGFMHAGAEYRATASSDQEAIARKMIDLGAEFAIGNSPHWVQNGEVYKNKPIFYSTGNFIFDQIDSETMRGLSIDVAITVPYSDNVAKWLAIGESCKPRSDNCLETAKAQKLKKFDIKLTYDVVGSAGGSRRVTQRADANLQKAIEERVGWPAMKQLLGQ